MTMRRTALLLIALGGFALTATSLLMAANDSPTELEKKLQGLLQDRIATAKQGVEANHAAYQSGTITLDEIIKSHQDLAEARFAVAKNAAEREAALEEAVQGLRQMEELIERLSKSRSRGGEANQMAMITVARQSAEIRLIEEQLHNSVAK